MRALCRSGKMCSIRRVSNGKLVLIVASTVICGCSISRSRDSSTLLVLLNLQKSTTGTIQ